jgi:hypothetical protein
MSKESAAAILVQTLFTTDTSMEHLMMSHAKIGNADPGEIAKFIVPYYTAMLKAMDGEGAEPNNNDAETKNKNAEAKNKSEGGAGDSGRKP